MTARPPAAAALLVAALLLAPGLAGCGPGGPDRTASAAPVAEQVPARSAGPPDGAAAGARTPGARRPAARATAARATVVRPTPRRPAADRTARGGTTAAVQAFEDDAGRAAVLPGPPPRPQPPVGPWFGPRTLLPTPVPAHPQCAPLWRQGSSAALAAAPGRAGGLVVTWWHNGDPSTVRYRVGVQPDGWVRGTGDTLLTRPPIVWVTVAAPRNLERCRGMSHAVAGARAGTAYTVWLEVEVRTPEVVPPTSVLPVGRLVGVTAG